MNLFSLALRNVLRNRRRSLTTILAIAIGLAAVNLFGGYVANVYSGLRDQAVRGERLGHLTIYKRGMLTEGKLQPKRYMFTRGDAESLAKIVRSTPGVVLVTPRLSVSGIVSNGSASTIFIGEGVDPKDNALLRGDLSADSGGRLDPTIKHGVAVSAELSKLLKLNMGDDLTLLTSTIEGQANALDGKIINVFNTGNPGTNDKYILVPFAYGQGLMDTEGVERFVVLLDNIDRTLDYQKLLADKLRAAGFDVEIKTWMELSSFYSQVRQLFDMIFGFIASIVFVVVAMGIGSSMAMTVIERTREIGTLRAIGLRRKGVMGLFSAEGAWLALIGGSLGFVVTVAVALLVNNAGISYTPPNSSYNVPLLIDFDWPRIAMVTFIVLALSLLATFFPARRAARLHVVQALSHT